MAEIRTRRRIGITTLLLLALTFYVCLYFKMGDPEMSSSQPRIQARIFGSRGKVLAFAPLGWLECKLCGHTVILYNDLDNVARRFDP